MDIPEPSTPIALPQRPATASNWDYISPLEQDTEIGQLRRDHSSQISNYILCVGALLACYVPKKHYQLKEKGREKCLSFIVAQGMLSNKNNRNEERDDIKRRYLVAISDQVSYACKPIHLYHMNV
uniref:Uncharacterized protein n=1 Tax=Romanomermis culicivorax TaxID=13658 RepID=A0A915IQ20_ROMCU